jgi:hypothetical protein
MLVACGCATGAIGGSEVIVTFPYRWWGKERERNNPMKQLIGLWHIDELEEWDEEYFNANTVEGSINLHSDDASLFWARKP